MYAPDVYTAPDEVGHSWPALGIKLGFLEDHGRGKEIHDNEMIRVLPVGGEWKYRARWWVIWPFGLIHRDFAQ